MKCLGKKKEKKLVGNKVLKRRVEFSGDGKRRQMRNAGAYLALLFLAAACRVEQEVRDPTIVDDIAEAVFRYQFTSSVETPRGNTVEPGGVLR